MAQASYLFLTFCLYSFLGWVCESIYCSAGEKRLINRGFLNGPVCPVYGFGAVIVVKLLTPFENNLVLLFLTGMAATSVLEYFTGYLLETLFHTKWWDYSQRRCNIRGRVCLRNSLMFGGLSVIAMKLINPVVAGLVARLHGWVLYAVAGGALALFAADTVVSVRTVLQLNGKLEQLQKLAAEIKKAEEEKKEAIQRALEERAAQRQERRMATLESTAQAMGAAVERLQAQLAERRAALASRNKFLQERLLNAFPNMQPHNREQGLEQLKAAIEERRLLKRLHKK